MDRDGNMARWIRAATETLDEFAMDYNVPGFDAEREEIEEVREALGRLHRLPDPPDEDGDEDGPDEYE
jgi:hypothetical protein